MKKTIVNKYFNKNAASWAKGGYCEDDYNYPVAYHRALTVIKILSALKKKKIKVADLGCGPGSFALMLAGRGYDVTGVDQSRSMVSIAGKALDASLPAVKKRVRFIQASVESVGLSDTAFDVVTSMGVIGYLKSDSPLFKTANRLLKPGGLFLVSCRNRLFNMISITDRTVKEVTSGSARELIAQINELYKAVPAEDTDIFIKNLKKSICRLPKKTSYPRGHLPNLNDYSPAHCPNAVEARQHTPLEIERIACKFGFKRMAFYGIHPHIIAPAMNRLMPPKIYNRLSECLEAFSHLPASLIWSSHFIGVFKKG